jgi:methylmalonyl-CoA mutase N-terminal domain/subunit
VPLSSGDVDLIVTTGVGGPSESAARANDGEVPIERMYQGGAARGLGRDGEAAVSGWAAQRAKDAPPYRPRFMVYSGLGSPAMTSERLNMLQGVGAESFLLAADLPSQLGFDPDHPLAYAQVGRSGVNCTTLADIREIFSGVDLNVADSLGLLFNSLGHVGLGMISVVREERRSSAKLVIQNDPLKEYTARGTEIFPPADAVRIACDCVAYAIDEGIPGAAMTVCSNHYDVAGSGPIIAMAMAFANAIVYVDELARRGYEPADVAEKLMFFLNERSDMFVQAALFRVARTIWQEILADRYGCRATPTPMKLMGYAHGLESATESMVNIPRITLSVLGSMLGGVDYLCASSYDEALRIPSADAAALAVRTMQVVAYEHGAMTSVDPLAGSYKLQDISDYLYTSTWAEIRNIERNGGGLLAIDNGYIKSCIDKHRGTREDQLARGERVMVGYNHIWPPRPDLFTGRSSGEINFAAIEQECVDRVQRQRAERDGTAVERALRQVTSAAAAPAENLLPPTITALREGATSGEIVAATAEGLTS